MFEIENTIVSSEIIDNFFCCDLKICKGMCCIEGDSGAPIEDAEKEIIENVYSKIKPYLRPESIKEIEQKGKYVIDYDNETVTTIINGKECVYVIFENGIAKCAFEKAYYDKKIDFKKPISCHLYPIRITEYQKFDAVNCDKWDICKSGFKNGEKLNLNLYKYLKEPLIKKYGKEWYEMLTQAGEGKIEYLTN